MRVTIHERAPARHSRDPRWEGTRSNVYELKIELGEEVRPGEQERIEIAHQGMFYRIEPDEAGLRISLVGVSVEKLAVCPRSENAITVSGLQKLGV